MIKRCYTFFINLQSSLLSIHPPFHPSIHLFSHSSIQPPIHLPNHQPVHSSTHAFAHPPTNPSIHASTHSSTHLPIWLSPLTTSNQSSPGALALRLISPRNRKICLLLSAPQGKNNYQGAQTLKQTGIFSLLLIEGMASLKGRESFLRNVYPGRS